MEYLTLGKIVGTFGLKGDLKIISSTDFADIRYKEGNKVYLFNESTNIREQFVVSAYRREGNLDIIRFRGFEDINAVTPYLQMLVQVTKDASLLAKDEYFHSDLIGCSCLSLEGERIGTVKKIEEYASYRTLRIARENGKDVLVPFVQAFIREINIKDKLIYINVIEGLL